LVVAFVRPGILGSAAPALTVLTVGGENLDAALKQAEDQTLSLVDRKGEAAGSTPARKTLQQLG
jgi:hypothetical protein